LCSGTFVRALQVLHPRISCINVLRLRPGVLDAGSTCIWIVKVLEKDSGSVVCQGRKEGRGERRGLYTRSGSGVDISKSVQSMSCHNTDGTRRKSVDRRFMTTHTPYIDQDSTSYTRTAVIATERKSHAPANATKHHRGRPFMTAGHYRALEEEKAASPIANQKQCSPFPRDRSSSNTHIVTSASHRLRLLVELHGRSPSQLVIR
jgi:hypothetical protein